MTPLVYQVAVGPQRPLYEKCIVSVAAYCQRHGFAHKIQREPILRIRPLNSCRSMEAVERLGYLPIYEKENALAELDHRKWVMILDADVYIRSEAPCIFDYLPNDIDFAGVPERFAPILSRYAQKLDSYERAQYGPLSSVGMPFINMGVMVLNRNLRRLCPETPAEFLRRPAFQRFINGEGAWKWSTDQTLMNWWLRSSGARIHPLGWQWNALYGMLLPGRIQTAYFVHFLLPDHLRSQDPEELLTMDNGRIRI